MESIDGSEKKGRVMEKGIGEERVCGEGGNVGVSEGR